MRRSIERKKVVELNLRDRIEYKKGRNTGRDCDLLSLRRGRRPKKI